MKKIITAMTVAISTIALSLNSIAVATPSIEVKIPNTYAFLHEEYVDVPIYIGGDDVSSLILNLKETVGITLLDIDISLGTGTNQLDKNIKEQILLYSNNSSDIKSFDIKNKFASLKYKLASNAKAGDEFQIALEDLLGQTGIDASDIMFNLLQSNASIGKIVAAMKADANLDNKVDSRDSALVQRHYAGNLFGKDVIGEASTNSDLAKYSADVDENGVIDSRDAALASRYYAESIMGTPNWDKLLNN